MIPQFSKALGNPPEPITALTPAAWYRYGIGLTDAGAGACSAWADQSGNGRTLTAAGGARPTIQADKSVLFDGVANTMATAGFTLNQPFTEYALLKQVAWGAAGRPLTSGVAAAAGIIQRSASPIIGIAAPTGLGLDGNLAVGSYGIVAAVFNGASSSEQVNNNSATSGNAGTNNPGGLVLGSDAGATTFTNIQVKEVIAFSAAHDAATRAIVITYLAAVGGLNI